MEHSLVADCMLDGVFRGMHGTGGRRKLLLHCNPGFPVGDVDAPVAISAVEISNDERDVIGKLVIVRDGICTQYRYMKCFFIIFRVMSELCKCGKCDVKQIDR